MKRMKRILSLMMALIIFAELLPAGAAADDLQLITAEELTRLELYSGLDSSTYHAGMTFSSKMTGYQMFCWLDDFIGGDLARLNTLCDHFRLDADEHLRSDKDRARVEELTLRAEMVTEKLNYYVFALENEVEVPKLETAVLNDPDASQREILSAGYRLRQALTDLPEIMSEFAAYQPEAKAEVEQLLKEMEALHQDEAGNARNAPNLRISNAGLPTNGGDADFRFTVLGAEDICIRLYDKETLVPVADAIVTITDEEVKHVSTVKTDREGYAVFDAGAFNMNDDKKMNAVISIIAEGYREIVTTVFGLAAGEVWEAGLTPDNGFSYLEFINFRGVDILRDVESVDYTPYNDAEQTFQVGVMVKPGSGGSFQIAYRDATCGENRTKTIRFSPDKTGLQILKFDDQWCRMLWPDTAVVLTFTSELNGEKETVAFDSLIDVKRAVVDQPVHGMKRSLFLPGIGGGFTLPENVPLFGGTNIAVKVPVDFLDKVPVDFNMGTDGSFVLSVGLYAQSAKINNAQGKTPQEREADADWKRVNSKQSRELLRDFMKSPSTLMKEFRKGLEKKANKHKLMDYFNVAINVSVLLTVTGKVQENKDKYVTGIPYTGTLDLFTCLQAEATVSYYEPFSIMGLPFFFGLDLSIGFSVGMSFMLAVDVMGDSAWDLSSWRNPHFVSGMWDIIFSPYVILSAYFGLGVKKLLSVFLKGTISLVTELHIRPFADVNKVRLKASLSFRIDVVVTALFFTVTKKVYDLPIWSKDSDKTHDASNGSLMANGSDPGTDPREDLEPVHYTRIETRRLADVEQESQSAKFVKYDNAVYYFDKAWLDRILLEQQGGIDGRKHETVDLNPQYFKTTDNSMTLASLRNWKGGIGHGAFPGNIPDDAYVAYFDVTASDQVNYALWHAGAGTGQYLNIGFLILFARRSEDEVTVTDGVEERHATRYYCELDVMSNTSTIWRDSASGSYEFAEYGNIQTVGIGTLYEITDPRQVHLRCDEEIIRESGGNRGENVYYAYSLLDGNELYCGVAAYQHYYRSTPRTEYGRLMPEKSRHTRILLDSSRNAVDAFVFRAAEAATYMHSGPGLDTYVLYDAAEGGTEQTAVYTRYALSAYDSTMNPGNVISTMSQNLDARFMQLLPVENEVGRPAFILGLTEQDEYGRCPLYLQEIRFSGSGSTYAPESTLLTDTGVRVSPADFSMLKVGSNYVLFYPEKQMGTENSKPCYVVKGAYISRDAENNLVFTHQLHLGEFVYTGEDAAEVDPDSVLVGFEMFRNDGGFVDGAFVEKGNAGNKLTYFNIPQNMQLDIRALTLEALTVRPGDTVNLLFSVMNTGNVPLTEFTLRTYAEDAAGNQVDISTLKASLTDPDESAVIRKEGGTLYAKGKTALSLYDTSDDPLNLWFTKSGAAYQTYEVNKIMPDDTCSFRAAFTVPADFKTKLYTIHMSVESLSTEAFKRENSELYDSAFVDPADSPVRLKWYEYFGNATNNGYQSAPVTVTARLDNSAVKTAPDIADADCMKDPVPVTLSVEDRSGRLLVNGLNGTNAANAGLPLAPDTLPDKAYLALDDVNLSISANPVLTDKERMVHIVLRNESMEPVDRLVLTAYIDGTQSWQYSFDPSLSLDYKDTISMDLPEAKLTGGREGRYLDISIEGKTEDILPVNNVDRLLINYPFAIIMQPEDATAPAGKDAVFTVAASGGTQPYTFRWQRSSGRRGPWTDIAGADGETLTRERVTEKDNGTFVRAVVTDAEGNVLYSDAAMLIVTNLPLTGDTGMPAVWLCMTLLPLLGIALLLRRRRKQI
ncbi:MAG: immunoglobulin domain-containing protein [Clostridia bacterium]|nr:immunoglobulin domain-containing protein [Clostridia bacterium]